MNEENTGGYGATSLVTVVYIVSEMNEEFDHVTIECKWQVILTESECNDFNMG